MVDGGSASAVVATAGMKELEALVKSCQLCALSKTRANAVPGEGDTKAEVMFIGEGPGFNEDKQGRPFVGQAGTFLNELLKIAGLDRQSVYITNVVKCRPPGNRDPEPVEIAACAPYLERQIELINPRVIVTLGRYSMARFFPGERIGQIHGTARMVDGRLCVAMYHPAAGLHQASLADVIRADFRKLPIYLEQVRLAAKPTASSEETPEVDYVEPTVAEPDLEFELEPVQIAESAVSTLEVAPEGIEVAEVAPKAQEQQSEPEKAASKPEKPSADGKSDDYEQMTF